MLCTFWGQAKAEACTCTGTRTCAHSKHTAAHTRHTSVYHETNMYIHWKFLHSEHTCVHHTMESWNTLCVHSNTHACKLRKTQVCKLEPRAHMNTRRTRVSAHSTHTCLHAGNTWTADMRVNSESEHLLRLDSHACHSRNKSLCTLETRMCAH